MEKQSTALLQLPETAAAAAQEVVSVPFRRLELPVELDQISSKGRVGLISLDKDFLIEQDLRRILPNDVALYTNRVDTVNPLTMESLRNIGKDITRAARGILPGVGVEVMIFGCTSGTVAIGEEKINSLINAVWPSAVVTTPVTAALAAFEALRATRISILTPYNEAVTCDVARYFASRGLEVVNSADLGFEYDVEIYGVPPAVIVQAALAVIHPSAELLFISCTNFRALQAIESIEQIVSIPVVTSNQALGWHTLKLLERHHTVYGHELGKLFKTNLPLASVSENDANT